MAVFRIERTRDYTVMSNHHLRNANLSLKAKGLLSMMLSLPEDWNYTTRGLAKICKEGVDAIGAALRELEAAGYIVRHKLRDRQGRISDTEYVIYEQPQLRKPDTDSPDTENPYMDGRFSRIPMKLSLTSRPLTLCRKSVGMSDATRTAGAKQLPSQACFIVPIAAARCMSTVPTTASVFLNIPVHSTPKFLAERSARPSTVSTKMWYCPLSRKC